MQVLRVNNFESGQKTSYIKRSQIKDSENASNFNVTFKGQKVNIYQNLLYKFLDLFQFDAKKLPSGILEPKISSENKLLGFKLRLEDEKMLIVTKCLPDRNMPRSKSYIVFKETGNGAFKDFIGIDSQKGNFIYLDKSSVAKPIFDKGYGFKEIPLFDEKHAIYETQVEGWLKKLFTELARTLQNQKEAQISAPGYYKPNLKPKVDNSPIIKANKVESPNQVESTHITQVLTKTESVSESQKSQKSQKLQETKVASSKKIPAGILDKEIQEDVTVITDIAQKLNDITKTTRDNIRTRPIYMQFRMNYDGIIFNPNGTTRGVNFKYGDGEILKALCTRHNPRYLRIIHTDKFGKESLILLEDNNKVVSNTHKERLNWIPGHPKYYSQDELQQLPIKQYTKFLRTQMEKYYADLTEFMSNNKPQKKRVVKKVNDETLPPANIESKSPTKTESNAISVEKVPSASVAEVPSKVVAEVPQPSTIETPKTQENDLLNKLQLGEVMDNFTKIVEKMAKEDAQNLAKKYVEIFIAQFKKSVTEQIETFQSTIANIFN